VKSFARNCRPPSTYPRWRTRSSLICSTSSRRYYNEGDFLSLRRYKEGVYAIPYEGEEVKLYWANHDQYYIKSSEYLRTTRQTRGWKTRPLLPGSADIDKDNNKSTNGNDRDLS